MAAVVTAIHVVPRPANAWMAAPKAGQDEDAPPISEPASRHSEQAGPSDAMVNHP